MIYTDTLLIGIITKNVIEHLDGLFNNIEKYIYCQKENDLLFKNYKVLFVDGNSNDGTYEKCLDFCNKDLNNRKVMKQLNCYLPRPLSLEQARNMYIEYFEKYFNKGVFLLILDADDVNSKPIVDMSGFLSCFNYNDWDFMGGNQSDKYYDIWTLRSKECPYDCWEMVRKTGNMDYVNKHHIHIPKNNSLIEVDSAFGGIGIYNTEKLKGLRYRVFREDDYIEQCEHVGLNKSLQQKGGKLYINPAFINF